MARETRDNEVEEAQGAPAGVNRAMRRLQQREESRQAVAPKERRRPAPPPTRERTGPREFGREVRGELKKVAWPGRAEVVNSTIVVLIAVVVLTSIIFGFDFAFGKFVLYLYE